MGALDLEGMDSSIRHCDLSVTVICDITCAVGLKLLAQTWPVSQRADGDLSIMGWIVDRWERGLLRLTLEGLYTDEKTVHVQQLSVNYGCYNPDTGKPLLLTVIRQ